MDAEAGEVMLDLLGDPIRAIRDPRGRPQFAKTKENQRLVITLRGSGWTEADIAGFMGCDPKTLRKHFSRELDSGALFLEGMALQVLVQKMLDGHVGAAKEVRDIARSRAPKGSGKPAMTPDQMGKKAKLARDAQTPPQGWGDLLPN